MLLPWNISRRPLAFSPLSGPSRSGYRAAQDSINLSPVDGIANDVRRALLLMAEKSTSRVYRFFLRILGQKYMMHPSILVRTARKEWDTSNRYLYLYRK